MLNYRTYCGKCNKYVYMGDLVTCQKGADCGLKGNPKIEEIPLDFDRTAAQNLPGPDVSGVTNIRPLPSGPPVPGAKDVLVTPEGPVVLSASDRQVGGDHYASQAIQPIHYIFENNLGFCEGNVIKYVTRYQKKNGVEDLKKARHYLDMLIERLEAK